MSMTRGAITSLALATLWTGPGVLAAPRVEVQSFILIGVHAVSESALKSVLATRSNPWLPWGTRRYFDPDVFQADLERILGYYRDHGFPNARIDSYDVDYNSDKTEVKLTVRVHEGKPTIVRGVEFEGFSEVEPGDLDRFLSQIPVERGEPVVHAEVLTTGEMAANLLRNAGYPDARVKIREEFPETHSVMIHYQAQPGTRSTFGPITITGNRSVSDDVIRRGLAYRPGEMYQRRLIQESEQDLYGLELFEFADVKVSRGKGTAVASTHVTVVEGKHRRVNFAVGYGTEEKARAEANWRHVNFFGGARTLSLEGKYSSLDRGGEATFTQPFLFNRNLALDLNGHEWHNSEPAFSALSRGGRATLRIRAARGWTASLSLVHEYIHSEISNEALGDLSLRDELIALGLDPSTGSQDGTLASVSATIDRNTVPNPLNPERGSFLSLHLEQGGSWLPGSFGYVQLLAEGRHYVSLADSVTWANRVRIGSIDPISGRGVPFFKRYFLGGSTSLRGWGRYEVSPLSGSGLPIGGHSLLEASSELRLKLPRNLGLVLFADAGNVWRDAWRYHLEDLVYDVGPGLRYRTPVGPLRLDFAWQLSRIPGLLVDGDLKKRRWRIHFAVGPTF